MDRRFPAALMTLATLTIAAGCGSPRINDGAPSGGDAQLELPDDAVPRPEPKSRYGNGPVYEVFGKRYTVLGSSEGYRERGVASWYGRKFHGRLTASREPYDMYAMTAAHKSLPLPTYVRVRNLRNDRTVVVRVNDRGPFVANRIIDLSYSAARKLGMVRDGTSMVEVEAISFGPPAGDRPTRELREAPVAGAAPVPNLGPTSTVADVASDDAADQHTVYAQTGAFSDRGNAERQFGLLRARGIHNALIYEELNQNRTLYRVRVGPITNVVQYDELVQELESLGIGAPYLVTD